MTCQQTPKPFDTQINFNKSLFDIFNNNLRYNKVKILKLIIKENCTENYMYKKVSKLCKLTGNKCGGKHFISNIISVTPGTKTNGPEPQAPY